MLFDHGIDSGNCILIDTGQNENNETMAKETVFKSSACVYLFG